MQIEAWEKEGRVNDRIQKKGREKLKKREQRYKGARVVNYWKTERK